MNRRRKATSCRDASSLLTSSCFDLFSFWEKTHLIKHRNGGAGRTNNSPFSLQKPNPRANLLLPLLLRLVYFILKMNLEKEKKIEMKQIQKNGVVCRSRCIVFFFFFCHGLDSLIRPYFYFFLFLFLSSLSSLSPLFHLNLLNC